MKILFQNPYANFIRKHPIFTVINIILGSFAPILFLFLIMLIKDSDQLLKFSNIFFISLIMPNVILYTSVFFNNVCAFSLLVIVSSAIAIEKYSIIMYVAINITSIIVLEYKSLYIAMANRLNNSKIAITNYNGILSNQFK